jgi:hypothetical protein
MKRSFLHQIRQPEVSSTRLTQGLFFALILCAFYAPVTHDQESIQNRTGLLYELTALCFIGMLSAIAIYPSERDVFYREYVDGHYPASSFISCYVGLSIPVQVVIAVAISLLVTCAIGLKPDGLAIAQFAFVIFCFIFNGDCLGVIFCSLFDDVGYSVNVVSPVISFLCAFTLIITLVPLFYLTPKLLVFLSPLNRHHGWIYFLEYASLLCRTGVCLPFKVGILYPVEYCLSRRNIFVQRR